MVTRFMDYVSEPYPGYVLKPRYSKIISNNPSGCGRLFRDANGRPADNVLAAIYLGGGPHFHLATDACEMTGRYPGKLTYTTMDAEYDPHHELEWMRAQNQN